MLKNYIEELYRRIMLKNYVRELGRRVVQEKYIEDLIIILYKQVGFFFSYIFQYIYIIEVYRRF